MKCGSTCYDTSGSTDYLYSGSTILSGHAYRFDLRTGRCMHEATLVLRRYPVTLVGDEVWVDLL